jgi:hypothetical protein
LLIPHDGRSAKITTRTPDRVAGERVGAEGGDDAHEADPARGADEHLQRGRPREPDHLRHQRRVEREVAAPTGMRPPGLASAQSAYAAPTPRPIVVADGRAGDAELGERPDAEHEARPEHDVDGVGEPEHAHRDRRVARAAEQRVDDEQHDDHRLAAEHDARVPEPVAITRARAPMSASRSGAAAAPAAPSTTRDDEREHDRLHRRPRRALGSFSPMRRATTAVAPMPSPIASAYTMASSDSVSPTRRRRSRRAATRRRCR